MPSWSFKWCATNYESFPRWLLRAGTIPSQSCVNSQQCSFWFSRVAFPPALGSFLTYVRWLVNWILVSDPPWSSRVLSLVFCPTNSTHLASLDSQFYFLSSRSVLASAWTPPSALWMENFLWAVSWSMAEIHLTGFPSLRDPCPLLIAIQYLESCCLFVFSFVSARRVHLIPVSPVWPDAEARKVI